MLLSGTELGMAVSKAVGARPSGAGALRLRSHLHVFIGLGPAPWGTAVLAFFAPVPQRSPGPRRWLQERQGWSAWWV